MTPPKWTMKEYRHFQEHIRQYSLSLALTSLSGTRDSRFDGKLFLKILERFGIGMVLLIPEPEAQSSYVQIYFLECC